MARSTADAIKQCQAALCGLGKAQWVLEADIQGCYDHISHEWMLKNIPTDVLVLGKWLRAGYIEDGKQFPTTEGTPQGGIISPTLANMTLDGLQTLLEQKFPKTGLPKSSTNQKVNLVRYADDLIVTGSSRELLENEVRPMIEAFLNERGLRLSPEKTKITHIDEGFDFLGQNIRRYKDLVLIKPSKKNTLAFLNKVREQFRVFEGGAHNRLIYALNPIIRGWVNYHRHVNASKIFGKVDEIIWRISRRWAKRRHPNKSAHWVAEKYWHPDEGRGWRFAADTGKRTENGKPIRVRLVKASETAIRRHVKIKSDANPFDPAWREYLEQRARFKRIGPELVDGHGFRIRTNEQSPVVKTGSATAEL